MQGALRRTPEGVPLEEHERLKETVKEVSRRLEAVRGEEQELRLLLGAVQARPPPKAQDLPRPAWVGDRPVALARKESLGSPRPLGLAAPSKASSGLRTPSDASMSRQAYAFSQLPRCVWRLGPSKRCGRSWRSCRRR